MRPYFLQGGLLLVLGPLRVVPVMGPRGIWGVLKGGT